VTLWKSWLLTIPISLGCAYSAEAKENIECEKLRQAVEVVSIHQDIRYGEANKFNLTKMAKLEKIMESLPLYFSDLNIGSPTLISERTAIITYLADVRVMIESAKDSNSLAPFKKPPRKNLFGNLNSFGDYWDCFSTRDEASSDIWSTQHLIDYYGAYTPQNGQNSKVSQASDLENILRQTGQTSGKNPSRVAYQSVELEQRKTVWLMLIGVLTLTAGTFLYQRRRRNYEIREERTFIQLPVKVRLNRFEYIVHLADISMNGAKIKHDEILATNDKVDVKIMGIWHAGQIKWSNDTFAGVMFKTPVKAEFVSAMIQS
jgi:LPXTG-motif cell wall-anchored protein